RVPVSTLTFAVHFSTSFAASLPENRSNNGDLPMNTITSLELSTDVRRRLLGLFMLTAAAILAIGLARAQSGAAKPTSFGPLKQIDAGLLNVGYVEAGPADGPAVILLHGWPYDINSYADVTPQLAAAGYRVIVPYLRGYGTTRFLSRE